MASLYDTMPEDLSLACAAVERRMLLTAREASALLKLVFAAVDNPTRFPSLSIPILPKVTDDVSANERGLRETFVRSHSWLPLHTAQSHSSIELVTSTFFTRFDGAPRTPCRSLG